MTQPPNGQGPQPREVWAAGAAPSVDLYRVLGIDPRTDAAVIRGNLNNRLTVDQQARSAGRPSDPNIQLVQLAINVIGDVDVKRLYDEAMTRSTDGAVYVAEVERLAALHTTPAGRREAAGGRVPNKPARRNPLLIGTAAFIAAMVVVLVLVLAMSCGDDGEPAADRGSGPVSTATDGQKYTTEDVKSGRAKFETVRTIDVAAMVPAASILGSKIGPTATQNFLIANEDGTLTLRWHGYADKYEWATVQVSDPAKVLDHGTDTANSAQVAALEAARGRGALSEEVQSAQVVKLGDTMYMVSSGRSGTQYAGKLYEVKIVEK